MIELFPIMLCVHTPLWIFKCALIKATSLSLYVKHAIKYKVWNIIINCRNRKYIQLTSRSIDNKIILSFFKNFICRYEHRYESLYIFTLETII